MSNFVDNPHESLPPLDDSSGRSVGEGLRQIVRGQVRFGEHDRRLYATDASPFRVLPVGVVVPADLHDVAAVVKWCGVNRVPILPRGGGTSLAGQCTNASVVLDLSAFCRNVISVDRATRECVVEAGVVLDELNRQLKTLAPGLFYAPDPATAAHATVGGCVGNNAAGSRSVRYGRTSENIAGIEVILGTGVGVWFEPGAGRRSETSSVLSRRVGDVVRRYRTQIRDRFATTVRRNAGYGLDLILNQIDRGVADDDLDLSGLICGSEGTLAVVTRARLKLHPIRPAAGLAVATFTTLDAAIEAVQSTLTTLPSAVELLDDVVLRAARLNPVCSPYVDLLPRDNGSHTDPAAVLYVEYQEESAEEVNARFEHLRNTLPNVLIKTFTNPAEMADAWTLRKSGEALLHGLPGRRKPQTFVEDNAVPVENLPKFVREFKKIVKSHGTEAAYWAHASVGVLHVRPMLDLHDEADLIRMQQIAVEVADLARACGGVMSGEHGDGRLRGPLLERFFGSDIIRAFKEIKGIFDPLNMLNPGNIVNAGPIESMTQNLRASDTRKSIPLTLSSMQSAAVENGDGAVVNEGQTADVSPVRTAGEGVRTYYDYADQDDFFGAVQQCNGAGFCRKTSGGTMCPSYRATLDERHSTRGRGNALREAIVHGITATGNQTRPNWNDPDTMETLDLCLSCKACKSECPSNVDIARLKAEYQAQSWSVRRFGAPLRARVFGHIRAINRVGSIWPGLANFVARTRINRLVSNYFLRLSPRRSMPTFSQSLYKWFKRRESPSVVAGGATKVVLFADCFTTYNESAIGRSAVRVLEQLGYTVVLPSVACCGRAMISTGLLPAAVASADSAVETLPFAVDDPSVKAVVVCEPSCLSAITDDWLSLKLNSPLTLRKALATKTFLVEDFVERFWEQHPSPPVVNGDAAAVLVMLHGHCHQKALGGDGTSAALLRRLTGGGVETLQTGCCGMAGSFGYDREKYDISMAIGELSLFPPVRSADASTIICAPGTSCRQQILDGTGRRSIHPVQLAEQVLCTGPVDVETPETIEATG